ncbi:MAG: four helix bundle protein [Polyangiaceae bacterium]|nr:four helix bundle protein [Polyangiaceae bacterium]
MQSSQLQHIVVFAIEIVARVKPVVDRCDRALADQLRRSINSVVLNLAEATGSDGGNRRARLSTARGSVYGSRAAIPLARAWGYVTPDDARRLDHDLDRLAARIFGFARS